MTVHCPQCDADVSDTYEPADHSVGIDPGWYCEACDLGIAEHEVEGSLYDDDDRLPIDPPHAGPVGTPISEIATQPGTTFERRAKYEEWLRISRSWGYD